MNPILLNPKIENDKSVTEQLQQMRSYLFQFKEQIELILSNIDSDNVSKNYEDALYGEFSRKFGDSEAMSQIIQTQSLIKLEVKEAVKMGDDKYSSFAITANGIKIKSTGTFTVDSGNFSIDSDGDVRVNGNINALSGSIGGYKIESDTIRTNQPSALKPGLALVSGVGPNEIALAIGFESASDYSTSSFFVTGNGVLHATGAEISGKITAEEGYIGPLAISNAYGLTLNGYTAVTQGIDGNNNRFLQVGDKTYNSDTYIGGHDVKIFAGGSFTGISCYSETGSTPGTEIRGDFWIRENFFQRPVLKVGTHSGNVGIIYDDYNEEFKMTWKRHSAVDPSDYVIVGVSV